MQIESKELFGKSQPYISELIDGFVYPWEVLPHIGEHIKALIESGLDGFTEIMPGIFAGENVTVSPTATLTSPAIIGANTRIGPGCYIRGNVLVGCDCNLGNSTELKNCIIMDNVQVPHYNYVGDSVLGNRSHMGAGATCSNLKADGKPVVIHGNREYNTGLRKVGAFLGDGADVGCHCVLNPGTVIGKGTSVYPLTSVRGVIPSGCIVKSLDNIVERI